MPRLKVCGVTNESFACGAAARGVDILGLIFAAGSPRCVTPEKAAQIIGAVRRRSDHVRFAGVFVSHPADEIAAIASELKLDIVQLHGEYGDGDVARLKACGFEVWRIGVSGLGSRGSGLGAPSFAKATEDETEGRRGSGVDAVLLDGRTAAGSGLADWTQVAPLKAAGYKVVLAGGIGEDNFRAAAATGADVIDVNSRLEIAPGVKSLELLDRLLRAEG